MDGQDKHARVRRRTDDDEVVYHKDEDGEDVEAGGSTRLPQARMNWGRREPQPKERQVSAIMIIFLRSLAHLVRCVQCSQ